jgi:cyclohexanone monooxygenase
VFQRTPNYSLPAFNRELTAEERAVFEDFYPGYKQALQAGASPLPIPPIGYQPTEEELVSSIEKMWNGDGLISLVQIPNLMRDAATNARAGDFVREQVKAIVKDPETADALTPRDFPLGAKRACVDTDYYETFNKPHVTLVDLRKTPIEAITPKGVRTSEREVEVDVIVYAVGFDAMTGALNRIDIRGRDGQALKDVWSEGPKTYLGVAVAGFPNLFLVTGPGSPSVLTNMMTAIEQHVDWITDAISYLGERQIGAIEAEPGAQSAWVAHVNAEADKTLFPQAASWYLGANVPGKPRVFMSYLGEGYKIRCDRVAANGYEGFKLTRRGEAA